jgi:hypothetical protein
MISLTKNEMKILGFLTFSILSCSALSQDNDSYWKQWNSRYPLVDIISILKYEKHYADSVEAHPKIPPYYARADKYRFNAEIVGQIRPIDNSIRTSMKTVYKLFIGNPNFLDTLFKTEVLMKIGEDSIWMPVQTQILEALKEEVSAGDNFLIYCLYLNEHSEDNGLRNLFLISEFFKK